MKIFIIIFLSLSLFLQCGDDEYEYKGESYCIISIPERGITNQKLTDTSINGFTKIIDGNTWTVMGRGCYFYDENKTIEFELSIVNTNIIPRTYYFSNYSGNFYECNIRFNDVISNKYYLNYYNVYPGTNAFIHLSNWQATNVSGRFYGVLLSHVEGTNYENMTVSGSFKSFISTRY